MGILFVVNPKAGNGKAKKVADLIDSKLRGKKVDYKITFTKAPEDATEIVVKNSNLFNRIVSVGGDGTLNEVVNGIVGKDLELAVIPAGTGNDFAKMLYPSLDIKKIIDWVVYGDIEKIDVGRCNDKYFINIASAGFDAEVANKVQRTKKVFSGKAAYLYSLFKTLISYKGIFFKIHIDNNLFFSNTLLITASNGRFYGGGMIPTPNADIQDGYFDICHVKTLNKLKLLALLNKYIKGTHTELKEVTIFKGKSLKIESEKVFSVNLDGEIIRTDKAEFEILKDAVKIVFPNNLY